MSSYKSIDQQTKDAINRILANNVLLCDRVQNSCIVTLDDLDNGTCRAMKDSGYRGALRAVQRNIDILANQLVAGITEFGDQFAVHRGDICKDFSKLARVWAYPHDTVVLYNFDLMGTFWGEPTLLIESIFKAPVGMNSGTLVAFTFQAIANGNIMTKLRNLDGWKERIRQYETMRSWEKKEIAQFYIDHMATLIEENRPTCMTVKPVRLDGDTGGMFENALVYGSTQKHASTMIFMLYEFRHDASCEHLVAKETVIGEKRKRVSKGANEVIEVEREVESSSNDYSREEELSQSRKFARLDDDIGENDLEESADTMQMDETPDVSSNEENQCPICLEVHFKHQTEAIEAISQNEKGIVHIPCGCGKSLIMKHVAGQHRFSAIFAPTKNLVEQIAKNYFEEDASFCSFKFNSDNKYKAKDISRAIKECSSEQPIVFVVNYQSYSLFQKLLGKLDITAKSIENFINENGRYPNKYTEKVDYIWLENQRKVKSGKVKGLLTDDRIKLLESFPNWTWK